MEAELRIRTNASNSVNVVTTLPFCGTYGMAGSKLAMRTRCVKGRLQHRQRLAMGGLLLIHNAQAQHGHQSRFVALPCE